MTAPFPPPRVVASLSRTTRLLHWSVGLGIVGMLAFGFWLSAQPSGPFKSSLVPTHKSLGTVLLALVLARVAWRWREGFPKPVPGQRPWERHASHLMHGTLLLATLLMPLSGMLRSLAYGRSVSVFGLPLIPKLFEIKQEGLYALAAGVHDWLAPVLAGLIALHAAAALKHHWLDRDDTLRRMLGTAGRAAPLALAILVLAAASALAGPDVDPATGYRLQNFRAPVTLPVVGGRRVDLAEVDRLRAGGAALIDVMPQRGGYDPATGAWRLVDKRATIPGAVWLPETGRGTIEPRLAAYLDGWLRKLSAGDPDHPLVFFCMADCWMSWNAVRRAADLGYRRIYWFADGTDGWAEADRALVPVEPPPVPDLGAGNAAPGARSEAEPG